MAPAAAHCISIETPPGGNNPHLQMLPGGGQGGMLAVQRAALRRQQRLPRGQLAFAGGGRRQARVGGLGLAAPRLQPSLQLQGARRAVMGFVTDIHDS